MFAVKLLANWAVACKLLYYLSNMPIISEQSLRGFVFNSFKDIVNSTSWVELWNIKHQIRLKVLHKLYYWQHGISVTLVEAIYKLIKVQRKTVKLIQNDIKFQWSAFIFLNRGFHAFVLTKFPLYLLNFLSCPYLTTPISIFNDSLTFLS